MAVRRESHVSLDPSKLMHQLQIRGHSAATFAKVAGVSGGTLSAILQHGRPISPRTTKRIAEALWRTQPIQGLADIMQIEED
jgi:transcriptional regulator with XRE-family HTH domain